MNRSLLRILLISCSMLTISAYGRSYPKKMKVKGECVDNQLVKNMKVKLVADGKATISGIVDRGVEISVIDLNVTPMGTAGSGFINEDGSFKITTWLRGQGKRENFSVHISEIPRVSTKLCVFRFKSKKGSLVRELLPSKQIQSDSEEIISLANQITEGATSDKEKLILIQDWMALNISFDYTGMFDMQDGLMGWTMPSALRTLERKKGICSETSMLSVALMRAAKVPTRSIYGTFRGGYHQWAESFIDGDWVEFEPQVPAYSVKDWSVYERINIAWRL